MGRFSDQFVETIRESSDLVAVVSQYVTLKKSGQNHTGLCPFHTEKTPSFSVSSPKQIFHCFGCGEGGNVFTFLSKMERVSFPEAVERLAHAAGILLPLPDREAPPRSEQDQKVDQIYRLNEEAAIFYHEALLTHADADGARAYLKERGLTLKTLQSRCIGFASGQREGLWRRCHGKYPQDVLAESGLFLNSSGAGGGLADRFCKRVLFPIRSKTGKVAGFGGRVMDGTSPKYLNTPETAVFKKGKHLFGIDQVRGNAPLVIVEGYFDQVIAQQAEIPNVIGTLGTALTEDHLHLIRRMSEKVVLIFDPDAAGVKAARRAAPLFMEKGVEAKVVTLPAGEDPDLFIRRHGQASFHEKLQGGESLIDFSIRTLGLEAKSMEDKKKVIAEVFSLLARSEHQIEQGYYLKKLAEELDLSEADVRAEFTGRIRHKKTASPEGGAIPSEVKRLPPAEEMLAVLLLQGPLDPARLNGRIEISDFTHSEIRTMLSHFWSENSKTWRRPDDLTALQSEGLFYRLSLVDMGCENAQKVAEDVMIRLRGDRLQREGIRIQKALIQADRDGDLASVKRFQGELFDLMKEKESNQLTMSR